MSRCISFLLFALSLSLPISLFGQEDGPHPDDGPPISITSPDAGTTFSTGTLKSRSLYWNKSSQTLFARVTFTDGSSVGTPTDDVHDFRLPGVTFDQAKGVFFATTAKGEVIPVARYKKVLFIKSIEVTPNAAVRILHPHGNLTVILEAISPNDPAMHPAPTDPDGTHKLDIDKVLN
jgi:hypothetical protein